MFKLLGVLAAMMSSVSGNAGQEAGPAPIHLVAEPAGDGVRVKVVGASKAAYSASFSLEVTSDGNRSLHRGSVDLQAGDAVTLDCHVGERGAGPVARASQGGAARRPGVRADSNLLLRHVVGFRLAATKAHCVARPLAPDRGRRGSCRGFDGYPADAVSPGCRRRRSRCRGKGHPAEQFCRD